MKNGDGAIRVTAQVASLATRPHESPGQVVGVPPPPSLRSVCVLAVASSTSSSALSCSLPPAGWGSLTWLAALPLAGAALIFWTVYRLQQDSVSRVRELEQTRTHLVDDSAARLRQIERDLHDGAQAQMVAVTMKPG